MKKLTAKDLLREVRTLKKLASKEIIVWFPDHLYDNSLEDYVNEMGLEFVDHGGREYRIKGDRRDLEFLWVEADYYDHGEDFEDYIVSSNATTTPEPSFDIYEVFEEDNWDRKSPNWELLEKFPNHDIWLGIYEVDASRNAFKEVPSSLRNLKNLQDLILSGNSLKKLPSWLPELKKLSYLDLSRNYFKEIPGVLRNMEDLNLFLSDNNITQLPEWLSEKGGDFGIVMDTKNLNLSGASDKLKDWVETQVED